MSQVNKHVAVAFNMKWLEGFASARFVAGAK